MTAEDYQALRARGEEILDEIITWRRTVHRYPELKMDTPVTEAFIVKTLREIGITQIRGGVGGLCTGLAGSADGAGEISSKTEMTVSVIPCC